MRILTLAILLIALQLCGCAGTGPSTIDRDRFDYISTISKSWKEQTLLNLVKIRYMDAPVFMDISSIISQYSLEREINAGLNWADVNSQSLGGHTIWEDRPTITYTPLVGEKFARSLLMPIPIPAVLLLIQSGYPADYIVRICVQAMNGLENLRNSPIATQNADKDFLELSDLLRSLQKMGEIAIRPQIKGKQKTMVIRFRKPESKMAARNLNRIRTLLGLDRDTMAFPVVHGNFSLKSKEIAILNRSLYQVMVEYAAYIKVPEADIAEGRVYAARQGSDETGVHFPPLTEVHSGTTKPREAFVAVFYRDHWFWIDDRDINSKAMFQFLMTLFSFTERGESEQLAPVITVPTN